jgi:hypothetical protein
MQIDRRSVLRGCFGATFAVELSGRSAAIPDSENPDYYAAQAKFVKKHAKKLRRSFKKYAQAFTPPTDEELGNLFVESLTPSLSTMLPGLVGQAVELKETLNWYESVGKHSTFSLISDAGVSTDSEINLHGGGGDAMRFASGELSGIDSEDAIGVSEQCNVVIDRAESCITNPSKSATNSMVAAMETLATKLDDLQWVRKWSNMDPAAYKNVAAGVQGVLQTTVDRIRENAQSVLDIAAAAREDVANKAATMADDDFLPLPAAIVKYNNTISDVRSRVPSWAFGQVAGDSFHIITETEGGEQMTVRWIDTNSNGKIERFEIVQQDSANADIIISDTIRDQITSTEDPIAAAQNAYNNGNVNFTGNGVFNTVKYDGLLENIVPHL